MELQDCCCGMQNFSRVINIFRSNLLLKNGSINILGQIIIYALNFITVPILLRFLGKEPFGIFQTIMTFLSWVTLANLGIGNGLRNRITEYYTIGEKKQQIKELTGSAFAYSSILSVAVCIIGTSTLFFFFNPSALFHNLSQSDHEIKITFIIAFIFFCVGLTLSLFSSISFAIHKSYLNTFAQIIQNLIFIILLIVGSRLLSTKVLIYVSLVYGIASCVSQIFPLIDLYKNKLLWPPKFNLSKKNIKILSGISLQFFFLQLASVILFSSDNFIISKFLGGSIVAEYSISYRLYFIVVTLFSIILIQVWSSSASALAKRDFIWIKKIVYKLHLLLLLVILILMVLSLGYNWIISIWIGENNFSETASWQFKLLFSVYILLLCSSGIFVNILNGIGRLRLQTFSYIIGGIIYFISCHYFIGVYNLNLIGLLISKIICILITLTICIYDYQNFIKDKI